MDATKVNPIMEQFYKSDGNGYRSKNNINHFAPLYESYYEESTNNRKKPNTKIIPLSEKKKGRKNKDGQNIGNEEYENEQENKTISKVYDHDSNDELMETSEWQNMMITETMIKKSTYL